MGAPTPVRREIINPGGGQTRVPGPVGVDPDDGHLLTDHARNDQLAAIGRPAGPAFELRIGRECHEIRAIRISGVNVAGWVQTEVRNSFPIRRPRRRSSQVLVRQRGHASSIDIDDVQHGVSRERQSCPVGRPRGAFIEREVERSGLRCHLSQAGAVCVDDGNPSDGSAGRFQHASKGDLAAVRRPYRRWERSPARTPLRRPRAAACLSHPAA